MRTVREIIDRTSVFAPVKYSVYCPKVIAAINSLAPATEDRCIVVELKQAPASMTLQSYKPDDKELKEEINSLKDLLNVTALKLANELTVYVKNPEKLELGSFIKNRHLDRWLPLLSIAKLLGFSRNYAEHLKELCMKDIDAKQLADECLPETQCRKIICEYVKDNLKETDFLKTANLEVDANDLFRVIKENDVYNSYTNKGQLTKILKRMKIRSFRKRVNSELTPHYSIPVSLLS